MISEASKREKIANAILGLTFAASAAQSPRDFIKTGHVEAPGTALMQRWGRLRGEAEKNLDSGRVIPKNKKMKTFKEFVEQAYLLEMRKEDKVKGKQKTPLYTTVSRPSIQPAPEGSNKKWQKTIQTSKVISRDAGLGRFNQGMGHKNVHGTTGGAGYGYKRHPHGGGGSGAETPGTSRGVKRTQTIQQRRERSSEEGRTPAQKVSDKRKKAAYKGYDYKKGFNQ